MMSALDTAIHPTQLTTAITCSNAGSIVWQLREIGNNIAWTIESAVDQYSLHACLASKSSPEKVSRL